MKHTIIITAAITLCFGCGRRDETAEIFRSVLSADSYPQITLLEGHRAYSSGHDYFIYYLHFYTSKIEMRRLLWKEEFGRGKLVTIAEAEGVPREFGEVPPAWWTLSSLGSKVRMSEASRTEDDTGKTKGLDGRRWLFANETGTECYMYAIIY